jgi:hypothetical protein
MKKVTWGAPQLQNPNSPMIKATKTFKQMWEAGQKLEHEQRTAQEYLQKATPAMVAILEYKLKNNEPLIVMRPLNYQTSEIGSDEGDGFYVNKSAADPKFRDVVKTILPGTALMLKSLDMSLQEFIFVDGQNNEHAINFADRNSLMTQTNVFEEVRKYFEGKEK